MAGIDLCVGGSMSTNASRVAMKLNTAVSPHSLTGILEGEPKPPTQLNRLVG